MEVTKTNFSEILPEITEVINNASFLCVDGEFTGLNDGEEVTAYDTPAQYYHKLREGAMSFLFFQFGLAAFQYDAENDRYTHRAYNFYLFPRPMNRYSKDCRFLCQSSSVDFLAEQGFDFNKVFREGIPYLSDPDEQTARENLEERRKRLNSTGDLIAVPNDLKRCVENACEQVQQFIDSGKEEQEIILERPTSFARRLFYQEAKQRFSPDQVALETKKWVVVARRIGGPEQRLKEEEERRFKEDLELETAVGFSRIIRELSKSGKFIVGHNLLLDLLHIIRQFYMPLPEDYEEFKELLHNLFPKVIDTKYMCSAPPFKDILSTTVLVNLLEALKAPPFNLPTVECEDGHGYQSLDVKHHEAGFDAYSTGLVFIALGNFLKKSRVFMDKQNASITESPLVEPYLNRLYLMRVIDIHICLSGEDPSPYRDHVFLMTFPKEWKHNEINRVFAAYGGIFTHWINDTSAWIALQHREQYRNVKNNLMKNLNDPNVTLVHYADVQNQINNSRNETVHEKSTPLFNKTFSSPATSAARKRFSDGNKSSNEVASNQKRQKRESLGKRRSNLGPIGTIPEEVVLPHVSKAKQTCARACIEELKKERLSPNKKSLQFEENDSWD